MKFFLYLIIFFCWPVLGFCAQEENVHLNFPKTVRIGDAFVVKIENKGAAAVEARVFWEDHNFPLPSLKPGEVLEMLLGASIERGAGVFPLTLFTKTKYKVSKNLVVRPHVFAEEKITVEKSMVTPPASLLSRIKKEAARAGKALRTYTTLQKAKFPFLKPVDSVSTDNFGVRRTFNNQPRGYHKGVDFDAPLGSEVRAAGAGRVILTGKFYYNGTNIFIDHGLGVVSVYLHLDFIKVREGDLVRAGEVIGTSGATGRVTGPHLHFGLYIRQKAYNPTPILQ